MAATIIVSPGVGTLQAAIDAASPKDQLRLQAGTYTGPVTVNKSLKISGYGDTPCVIDGDCAAAAAVDVAADGVSIASKKAIARLRIIRGTDTSLRVSNSHKVQLSKLQLDGSFSDVPCGTETTCNPAHWRLHSITAVRFTRARTDSGQYLPDESVTAHLLRRCRVHRSSRSSVVSQ